jgi:heat shock protein HslJ
MALLTFALVACGDDGGGSEGSRQLRGREFLSESVEGHVLVPGTQIRITFEEDQIGARAGCNLLGARYDVLDGRLVVKGDGISMTEMGCDRPRHDQDEWLAGFLHAAPRVELNGDSLTLTSPSATVRLLDRRVADPDRPLLGTEWRVDTMIQGDAASSVPDVDAVTLEFHDDGTLTATASGCTSARLAVDVDAGRNTLRFADFVIDAIGCPPPWEATVAVLRRGEARYSITAARLTITADDIGIAAMAD